MTDTQRTRPEHLDVLVVGAGLSGIGAGYRLQERCPDRSYAILESRTAIGGTWDLFRYPGVRSDSDMFTLGYPFRPWSRERSIAPGAQIRDYIRETAAEFGIDERIRFGHRVVAASWSTSASAWTVTVRFDGTGPAGTATGAGPESGPRPESESRARSEPEFLTLTCSFLYLCSGYYRYSSGHVVEFPGQDEFRGEIVHPQAWPETLDHAGRRVVVIGSGATAMTLVPAMAPEAEHVTLLQRSPGYVASAPGIDPLAVSLRKKLPAGIAYRLARLAAIGRTMLLFQLSRRFPDRIAAKVRGAADHQLRGTVPVDPHFTPSYNPWDQRFCLVPDADLFRALRSGQASIETDTIAGFEPDGVRLGSGALIEADLVVTATGLSMVAFGEIELEVDGVPIRPGELVIYKGMMFGGVPNLAWCIGYTNASWTLRADLTSRYVTRILRRLARTGASTFTPEPRPSDLDTDNRRPILDLKSGYVRRAASRLPFQGAGRPWRMRQNYLLDLVDLRLAPLVTRAVRVSGRAAAEGRPTAREQTAAAGLTAAAGRKD